MTLDREIYMYFAVSLLKHHQIMAGYTAALPNAAQTLAQEISGGPNLRIMNSATKSRPLRILRASSKNLATARATPLGRFASTNRDSMLWANPHRGIADVSAGAMLLSNSSLFENSMAFFSRPEGLFSHKPTTSRENNDINPIENATSQNFIVGHSIRGG